MKKRDGRAECKNGAKERNIEIAKSMKEEGCDIELIMKITNLSKEDIEKLT